MSKPINFIDLTGRRFGRLVVVEREGTQKSGAARWRCHCDCGKSKVIDGTSLRSGHTKSCGCLAHEPAKILNLKHGKRNTRLYGIWNGIKQRCYNPNRQKFASYGGRGITMCDEWRNDFKTFYDWAMTHGYTDELSIDRIDVNGNYEPSNCQWVTVQEQAYNKTTSVTLTYNGETKTIAEWAKVKGLKTVTLWVRLYRYNWSIEKALATPSKAQKRGTP